MWSRDGGVCHIQECNCTEVSAFLDRHKASISIKWRWGVLASLCKKNATPEKCNKGKHNKQGMPVVNRRSEELHSINSVVILFSKW